MKSIDELEIIMMSYISKRQSQTISSDKLYDVNLENLLHGDGIEEPMLYRRILSQIFIRYITENKYNDHEVEILNFVSRYLRNDSKLISFSEEDKWIEIFSLADSLFPYKEHSKINYELDFIDEVTVGNSMKFLKNLGYELRIKNEKIIFIENDEKLLIEDINKKIKKVGGIIFLDYIFKTLKESEEYSDDVNQFLFQRKYNNFAKKHENEIPWNYLIKVCLKNFKMYNLNITTTEKLHLYNEIILLATHYFSIMRIQDSNQYQHFFVDPSKLPEYLSKNVTYDNLFYLPQNNYKFHLEFIEELLAPLFYKNEIDKKLGFELGDYLNVLKFLINHGSFTKLKKINIDELCKKNKVERKKMKKILGIISVESHVLIKKSNKVPNIDMFEIPLILTSSNYGYLLPIPMFSHGMFELMSNIMRKFIKNYDQQLGGLIEKFLQNKLKTKGISFTTGYRNDNEECDLIIEADKFLIFIEIKKKSLTNLAKSGHDVYIFNDLAKSLISSQNQMLKHEIEIFESGFLNIRENRSKKPKNKGLEKKILLEKRKIIKISLSAYDYGFINDSQIVRNILKCLISITLRSDDKKYDDIIKEFNKEVLKLQKSAKYCFFNDIHSFNSIFFHSIFLSIEYLIFIVENSKDENELAEKLNRLLILTNGTANFYKNLKI